MLRYCHLVLGYTNLVYRPLRGPFRGPFREPNELQIVRNDQNIDIEMPNYHLKYCHLVNEKSKSKGLGPLMDPSIWLK